MPTQAYDIITVGGGIAASAFASAMAQRGASVLILEQETRFRDRVRGEGTVPWGVAFAHQEMQETLLAAAENVGAQVRRGVTVEQIEPGVTPAVVVSGSKSERVTARLVVAADGRGARKNRQTLRCGRSFSAPTVLTMCRSWKEGWGRATSGRFTEMGRLHRRRANTPLLHGGCAAV